ncbi:MAG: Trk system potassium transporter TrkA [Thermoguttaceae bacterium]
MRVVILGGGMVGSAIADLLAANRHTVTVVEQDPHLVELLDEQHQVSVVEGNASRSSALFTAGVGSADLCLAVTGNDETNLIAASMAKAMGARRVAARVYSQIFHDRSTFDYQHHFGIDRLLSIEYFTALELSRRIRSEGELVIEHFVRGAIEMQEVLIARQSGSTGKPLSALSLPSDVRIGAIQRESTTQIATASDTIEPGDRVTFIGIAGAIEEIKGKFYTKSIVRKKVVIAGGGETGMHLATILNTRRYSVRVMERSRVRCDELTSRNLPATVLCCDARSRSNLEEENVGDAEAFIACTGQDEDNILACVEAEAVGVPLRVAIIDRPDYANIVTRLGIQAAVSSRAVLASHVLSMLNTGAVVVRHSHMLGSGIDIVELEVQPGAPITQAALKDVNLPSPTVIGGVVQEGEPMMPSATFQFRPGDKAIAIVHVSNVMELAKCFSTPTRE